MKERPILFSGPMVRAILEGRKTQTRRIVKKSRKEFCDINGLGHAVFTDNNITYQELKCPYGQEGDRLWVRETWATDYPEKLKLEIWEGGQNLDWIMHRAHSDNVHENLGIRWRPSIHMPRWASRITLEVTGVRVERLQDISEEDAIAEGIQPSELGEAASASLQLIKGEQWPAAVLQYAELWQSINGPGSWEANPWVWVVEFKRVQKGGAS